jgi:hypothetical protein
MRLESRIRNVAEIRLHSVSLPVLDLAFLQIRRDFQVDEGWMRLRGSGV